ASPAAAAEARIADGPCPNGRRNRAFADSPVRRPLAVACWRKPRTFGLALATRGRSATARRPVPNRGAEPGGILRRAGTPRPASARGRSGLQDGRVPLVSLTRNR